MSHKHNGKHHPYCLNCHYPLSEFDKNCSQCGQKPTDGKTTVHDLVHEVIHTLFHLDGKFFWTLKHLFVPGKLTLEFFKGHHKRYAHPIQLFLVIGALAFGTIVSKTHKAEEGLAHNVDKKKKEIARQQFLLELDSVSQIVSKKLVNSDSFHDSLMLKMLYPAGLEYDSEKIRKEMGVIIDKELKKAASNPIVSFKVGGDSSDIQEFKDSLINVVLNDKPKSSEEEPKSGLYVDIDTPRIFVKNNETESPKEEYQSQGNPVKDFQSGVEAGLKESAIEVIKDKLNAQVALFKKDVNIKDVIKIKEDSVNILGTFSWNGDGGGKDIKIPRRELYELSPDSIIHKYHIEGFKDKVISKQFIKMRSKGDGFFHFFMSKLFWATFAIIPILAGFMMLVYWRQKRFYVEHIVFLIHYNTTLFLGIIITLYGVAYFKWLAVIFPIWVAIHFYLSLKNYYQQGWGKTFVKYSILSFMYFILSFFVMIITGIIGFLMF